MKTIIVYAHLLSACVALGILLMQDLALAKTKGKPLSLLEIIDLKRSAKIISQALIALWVSGLTLVLLGYLESGQAYLMNEKLWAKFSVVIALTINGVALHYFSFPRVVSKRGLLGLGQSEKTLVMITGAVSSASWLFACYLGIARPWNYTAEYSFIMLVYSGLLISACLGAFTVLHTMTGEDQKSRDRQQAKQHLLADSLEQVTKT